MNHKGMAIALLISILVTIGSAISADLIGWKVTNIITLIMGVLFTLFCAVFTLILYLDY
jgi:hypothetical protein